MAYIGLPPKANFTSGLLDRFTSTTGTTVTLTHDIASENDIVVFVNFVKQDSTTYSVGGTGNKTLTLGGTLVSSDIVEVHYLNIVGQTNAPSSGSVTTATINDNAVTGAKLNTDVISAQTALAVAPDSTDELLISDGGVLKRIDVSLVGGDNTPYFYAFLSASQTISDATTTTVAFDSELVDASSAYNTSNYRFTPQTAGYYQLHTQVNCDSTAADSFQLGQIFIRKNGTIISNSFHDGRNDETGFAQTPSLSLIVQANGSSDYFDVQGYVDSSSGSQRFYGASDSPTFFWGYKLIG